jgi:hypothetical protein
MHTLAFILLGSALPLLALDLPLTVEDSGSKEVDALVLQLVSTRPAPHPSGYTEMTAEEDAAVPYMTSQVSNAIAKLKAVGTTGLPALIKHLRDDRYSYSTVVASWDNRTVGDAVLDVVSDGHYMVSGYKVRQSPSGSAPYLSFKDYLDARGSEHWGSWARSQTRLSIQLDFIDWCVSREQERGFTDEAQRKEVLASYDQARKEARKQYSEPDGARAEINPGRENRGDSP